MGIRFKSFHDYTHSEYNDKFSSTYQKTEYATRQLEDFIKENNIRYSNMKEFSHIKDIKFSVDSKGNEHILLVYEEN